MRPEARFERLYAECGHDVLAYALRRVTEPEDAADVVAYLMKINGMPVGPAELPADPDALEKYRIEVKRTASRTSTAKRTTP